ncbi:hypothetical protein MY7_2899 [Bacillus sp. 5B6]|nr:hypothetical protein MY7_2899 [Bacillus sp. 5B6]
MGMWVFLNKSRFQGAAFDLLKITVGWLHHVQSAAAVPFFHNNVTLILSYYTLLLLHELNNMSSKDLQQYSFLVTG